MTVRVTPRAGRSAIAGIREGALLIRLAAAPVDGAANDALIELMSEALQVPKRAITIVSGPRGRSKRIAVVGLTAEIARARLADATPNSKTH